VVTNDEAVTARNIKNHHSVKQSKAILFLPYTPFPTALFLETLLIMTFENFLPCTATTPFGMCPRDPEYTRKEEF
jgi:hypothetical protein